MKNKILTVLISISIFNLNHLQAQNTMESQNKFMKKISENVYETSKITIEENPQKTYKLELKNGKPFNGYQVLSEKLLGEFPIVNQYKNGELISQYNVDLLAGDQFETYTLQLKTTFENKKIIDGYEYINLMPNILKTIVYKKGIKTAVYLDMFEMHYFNRLIFSIQNNKCIVSNTENSDKIEIYKNQDYLQADYLIDGKVYQTSKPWFKEVKEGTPNSMTAFYLDKQNSLQKFNFIKLDRELTETGSYLLFALFAQFSFKYQGDINQFIYTIDGALTDTNNFNFDNIFINLNIPYNETNLKGYVLYNSDGKISEGNNIEKKSNNEYLNKNYENGIKVSEEIISNILSFKSKYIN